ncbi:MAG: hypothetical protein AAB885_03685 [Patescibacteria group bacterium]
MASVLIIFNEKDNLKKIPAFIDSLKNIIQKVIKEKGIIESDRFRFGSALLIGPLHNKEEGIITILIQWPDGKYSRIPYEIRAYVSCQKEIDGISISS